MREADYNDNDSGHSIRTENISRPVFRARSQLPRETSSIAERRRLRRRVSTTNNGARTFRIRLWRIGVVNIVERQHTRRVSRDLTVYTILCALLRARHVFINFVNIVNYIARKLQFLGLAHIGFVCIRFMRTYFVRRCIVRE